MAQDRDMAMAAIRSVYKITGRINTGRSVEDTLQLIADAVVDGVGFGAAVVNYLHADGAYEAVAIAGSEEVRQSLLGARYPAAEFDAHLARAEPWGQLLFMPHDRYTGDIQSWIPEDLGVADDSVGDEQRWHPLDALFAPLRAPDGELVGVLSVDLPADGRRPGPLQRELLEMLAAQAGIAINNANLVDALRQERQHLAASEEAFRLAFEGAGAGLCLVALEDGAPTHLMRVNPALCELLGRDEDVLVSMRLADLVHPDDVDRAREAFTGCERAPVRDYEVRCVRGDGRVIWVSATVSMVAGSPPFAVTQVQDVTDRKATEADLVRRASRDPLTGLVNRDALTRPLEAAIEKAHAGATSALLFCDLDGFKAVNDTLGHDAGDAVLVAVAQRLVSLVRPSDTVARLGGDEFVILAERVGGADLAALVDRIERAVCAPISKDGQIMRVRVSIGVAVIDDTVDDPGAVLRAADRAMYLVKGARHGSGATARMSAVGDRAGARGGMPVLRLVGPETAQ